MFVVVYCLYIQLLVRALDKREYLMIIEGLFSYFSAGLPRSGKNVWKLKFFPGQGKVREFCGWPGIFR